jgi:hypothetical protein
MVSEPCRRCGQAVTVDGGYAPIYCGDCLEDVRMAARKGGQRSGEVRREISARRRAKRGDKSRPRPGEEA